MKVIEKEIDAIMGTKFIWNCTCQNQEEDNLDDGVESMDSTMLLEKNLDISYPQKKQSQI